MATMRTASGGVSTGAAFHPSFLPASTLLTDERLMAACAKGDTSAFDELYRRYGAYVRNFVHRKVTDLGHAEDVTQEVFVRLYRSAARFDSSRQFKKWLFTIAANEIRRYWSRNGRTPLSLSRNANDDDSSQDFQDLLPDSHESPDELYLNGVTCVRLRQAIMELPEFQRTALLLRTYRNLTLKEIADATGTTVATVNSRLHYATEKVRKTMLRTGFVLPIA